MTGIEHQVLKLMRLIYKEVINAHHLKVYGIVLAFGYAVLDISELNL